MIICKIVNSLASDFASVLLTKTERLKAKSNKTDAKLLASELTILQIYRPLKGFVASSSNYKVKKKFLLQSLPASGLISGMLAWLITMLGSSVECM